jgi:alpha,alpha-trehalase
VREPDFGIWELSTRQHYVSSKVMAWVALDRGVRLAEKLHADAPLDEWRREMEQIHAEVLVRGWSERRQAFKQRYESDNLDASALLIPVMEFLPADDPRVVSTISAVERELSIDGFIYRFVPADTPGSESKLPLGEFEGAFLPCTFWLATSYAKAGQPERAEAILANAEKVDNDLGLFAEGIDARARDFTGNFSLMFSQTEYIRAIVQTAKAQLVDRLRMIPGTIKANLHLAGH